MFEKKKPRKRRENRDREISRTLLISGGAVGAKNPMSRGQKMDGAIQVSLLQMMRDDDR